tara:strand:+ start:601 stop:924 length:324 start_codon:yes stop_codon:yes gene_type:complete
MSKKGYLNFHDFASILILSKKSTTLLLGLLAGRLKDLEKKQKSGQSFHTLIASIMVAQSIALVTLSIVVYQMQKKISSFQMVPNTQEERLVTPKVNGETDPANTDTL